MIDWQSIRPRETEKPDVVDSRPRLWLCVGLFLVTLTVIFGRAVHLELTQGEAFRAEARELVEREAELPAPRGQIVSADGAVLACDQPQPALSVHYRWLEELPNPAWLRRTALSRLSRVQRQNPAEVAAAEAALVVERRETAIHLQKLAGLSPEVWRRRAAAIQNRVERIRERVNRRRTEAAERKTRPPPATMAEWIVEALRDAAAPPREELVAPPLVIVEELDHHVMVDELPADVAREIEQHPDQYPGAKIDYPTRRIYPLGASAAHALGYLAPLEAQATPADANASDYRAGDLAGRTGLERQYEASLRGRRGRAVERIDHRGGVADQRTALMPRAGADLHLTLDSRLQRTAEELLDQALERVALLEPHDGPRSAAAVVLDVHSGAVRAIASAPRYNPNWFTAEHRENALQVLDDPARPLFDRAVQMALPPGSVFKMISAVALLQTRAVAPGAAFECQGYLEHPDAHRCEIFAHYGRGHGELDLAGALAESCNVYFFTHAAQMGPAPLVNWAKRFGFGRPTGIDLPHEAPARLPDPRDAPPDRPWHVDQTRALAIGQGELTATPLQVARAMAAVANGGKLVRPHLVAEPPAVQQATDDGAPRSGRNLGAIQEIAEIDPGVLLSVRRGLEMVVADPRGTAHATVFDEQLPIAGKTGTAEVGEGEPAHAWFAGYAPAESPRLALVIVIEHGGSGALAAGPVARRLMLRAQELGSL